MPEWFFLLWEHEKIKIGVIVAIVTAIVTKFSPWFFRMLWKGLNSLYHLLTGQQKEKQFEKQYLDAVIDEHQYLGLIPSTRLTKLKQGSGLTRLEQVYTTLQLALDEKSPQQSIKRESELFQENKPNRIKRQRFYAEEAELSHIIKGYGKIMIMGDPGSGKTTLLRYLLVTCARALRCDRKKGDEKDVLTKRLGWRKSPFPVFLSLIEMSEFSLWKGKLTLAQIIYRNLDAELQKSCPARFFEKKFSKENCILFLDAFDELGSRVVRDAVAEKVGSFSRFYQKQGHLIIATSRKVGYENQMDRYKFASFYVQDLDKSARARLIRQRYRALAIEADLNKTHETEHSRINDYMEQAEHLIARSENKRHIRLLMRNPLLLTLIVLIDHLGIRIPEQRHELYQECVDVLADHWIAEKKRKASQGKNLRDSDLTREDKIEILSAIATAIQKKRIRAAEDEYSLISRSHAIKMITQLLKDRFKLSIPADHPRPQEFHKTRAIELLDLVQKESGILIEKGRDPQRNETLIAFSHLSFQEYLCARLMHQNPKECQLLLDNLFEPAWHEVFLLYRAMSADEKIIHDLLQPEQPQPESLFLAAECLADNKRGIGDEIKTKIKKQLKQYVQDHLDDLDMTQIKLLFSIGGRQGTDFLFELLGGQKRQMNVEFFKALGQSNPDPEESQELAEKMLDLLEKPDKIGLHIKDAIGQALERLGDPRFESVEPKMVHIPAGSFLYGEDKKEKQLYGFYISQYPVTNIEYQCFIDSSGYAPPGNWKEGYHPSGRGNHPVVNVSFYDAIAYCRWLSQQSQTGAKYRLPTEIEWEKAARGTDGREYPWGDRFDAEKCNSKKSGLGRPCSVGLFSDGTSPYGIYDMAGNVWEWTDSGYDLMDQLKWRISFLKNRAWIVLRGGSWDDYPQRLRCADRGVVHPAFDFNVIGFRVVRSQSNLSDVLNF